MAPYAFTGRGRPALPRSKARSVCCSAHLHFFLDPIYPEVLSSTSAAWD
jgi:hypothetical protein